MVDPVNLEHSACLREEAAGFVCSLELIALDRAGLGRSHAALSGRQEGMRRRGPRNARCLQCRGGDCQDAEDGWSFEFAPFSFAAGMDGTAGVRGVEAAVDMDFETVLENLDSAFLARLEARRGPWGVAVGGIYFDLEGEEVRSWTGPLGNSNTAALDWTATEKVFQTTLSHWPTSVVLARGRGYLHVAIIKPSATGHEYRTQSVLSCARTAAL